MVDRAKAIAGLLALACLAAGVPVAYATDLPACHDGGGWDTVAGNVTFSSGFVLRFDSADFQPTKPDTYIVSLQDEATGNVLLRRVPIRQHSSISFHTRCGDTTLGTPTKEGERVYFAISFFPDAGSRARAEENKARDQAEAQEKARANSDAERGQLYKVTGLWGGALPRKESEANDCEMSEAVAYSFTVETPNSDGAKVYAPSTLTEIIHEHTRGTDCIFSQTNSRTLDTELTWDGRTRFTGGTGFTYDATIAHCSGACEGYEIGLRKYFYIHVMNPPDTLTIQRGVDGDQLRLTHH